MFVKKNKSFEEFVSKHSDGSQSVNFDVEREIKEWRGALLELYRSIEQFVSPYKDVGSVQLELTPITIYEESLGSYAVNGAVLRVGDAKYILSPIGTMLIGSKGRVDLLGPSGSSMLALVKGDGPRVKVRVTIGNDSKSKTIDNDTTPSDQSWKWKIVSSKPPYTYSELNEDNFLNLLMSLAR